MKKFALFICLGLIIVGPKSLAQAPAPQSNPQPSQEPTQESLQEPVAPTDDFQVPADDAQVAQPDQQQQAAPMANPLPPEMMDPLLEGFFEDVGYNPTDRRDPFLPYLTPSQKLAQGPQVVLEPLQKFSLAELKLVGIIWDVGKPKALIQDPTGTSHIIVENTKLGQEMGYVAAIREGEIIVVEQQISSEGKKSFQTKVIKLANTVHTSGT
jgi:type IV pilus assembly protein PilP